MNAIVVVDENWAIGKGNKLLVHLSGELKYYKEKTLGKHIVIGRKTLESFPGGKPLPNRENIVITHDINYENSSCKIFNSIENMKDYLKTLNSEEIFISGGEEIYKQMLILCNIFYVTHIMESFKGADKYFPNIEKYKDIKKIWQSDIQEESGVRYYFAKYQREK